MTPSDKSSEKSAEPSQPPTPIAPDVIEQDFPDQIDDQIPTRGYRLPPLVGIGGSAGIVPALTTFFGAMPADSGMIFVVVLHLSPNYMSAMPEVIQRVTSMPVRHAAEGVKTEPNHVYIIPPGKFLTVVDGHLKLTELENEKGKRVAVDLFFRSLADVYGPHSTAVLLSGADADGAIGIKRVKERGGLTVAQDPEEAEYSGMPRSAIDTGMVDWVLKAKEMPSRLIEYHHNGERLKSTLPPEEGPPLPPPNTVAEQNETALHDVLAFLRMKTGRDFSYYKRATILRRIARRMQVNGAEDLPAYLNYLRTHPGESGALLQDLLISVTNFFRDRDCFAAIERQIPELFKNKAESDTVRVWVPACATGEEAYSLAMLLLEYSRKIERPPALQIFACDLDDEAIQFARAGHYPDTIAADVSDERLARFFIKDHTGYRVRRELREMILFAAHDLLKDAPFSSRAWI